MKGLLLFGLVIALLGFYWKRNGEIEISEVITTLYDELSSDLKSELDQLKDGYDPRRFGLEVLNYIGTKESGRKIPFYWHDVVDRGTKTGLGLYHMDKFPVDQVVLLKSQLYHFPTKRVDYLTEIRNNQSISQTVEDFFLGDETEITHDFHHLNTSDFTFTEPHPYTIDSPKYRYFKEGSLLNQGPLSHYDLRFFHSRIEPIDRLAILHRTSRAWFQFTNLLELDTWIAHGSLLGYQFNGLIMPWDDDLDVQITASSFEKLMKYNRSIVIDYNDTWNLGKYLIDINPWYGVRNKESDNKIDARFIDVESGLYIDITTLSIGDIDRSQLGEDGLIELYKVFNPRFDQVLTEVEKHTNEIITSFNQSSENGSLVFCKDYHVYKIEELTPLIPAVFEGGIAYVSSNIQNLLLREYKRKSLYLNEYKSFKFDKFKRIWTHDQIKFEFNERMSKFIQNHDSSRLPTLKQNSFDPTKMISFDSFRVEPWIREYILTKSQQTTH